MTSFALFIGIDHYDDQAFTALSCPQQDAASLHALFASNLGLGSRASKLAGNTTASDISRHLRQIGKQLNSGDSFIFFFAGHGYQDPHKQDQYLLLHEANAALLLQGKLEGEILSLASLIAQTDHWQGVQRVFVLDACRSLLAARSATPEAFDNEAALNNLVSRDPGVRAKTHTSDQNLAPPPVIINACHDGQVAYESKPHQRGILSLALERCILREFQAKRQVLLGQPLLQAITKEMRELLQQTNNSATQHPFMTPENTQVLLDTPGQVGIGASFNLIRIVKGDAGLVGPILLMGLVVLADIVSEGFSWRQSVLVACAALLLALTVGAWSASARFMISKFQATPYRLRGFLTYALLGFGSMIFFAAVVRDILGKH